MAKKVIVADDQEPWRTEYAEQATDAAEDVHVDQVETGSELVDRVLAGNYSVVVSDNDMEEKGAGLKALRAIRLAGKQVPFYLISGGMDKILEKEVMEAGATKAYDKADYGDVDLAAELKPYLV
jgi:CheY-like chemotaxis protein